MPASPLRVRYRDEVQYRRLIEAFRVLASAAPDADFDVFMTQNALFRDRPRRIGVQVPIAGRARAEPTRIVFFDGLPRSQRALIRAIVEYFGPLKAELTGECEVWMANVNDTIELGVIPAAGRHSAHELLEAAGIIQSALRMAGLTTREAAGLLEPRF